MGSAASSLLPCLRTKGLIHFPKALSPDGRYLVFYYPGYSSSDRLFLAYLFRVEQKERGTYATDVESKAIYRLPDGMHYRWK